MDLADYWAIVRRRWWLIVAVFALALVAAGAFTMTATKQYASSARLFVSMADSSADSAYTGNLFATQRVTSYADLVDSRELAERVAGSLGSDLEPDDLVTKVKATVVPETVILQVTATDPEPTQAREIAQAYADELVELVDDLETPPGAETASLKATIVDGASLPTTAVSPQPVRNLALAAVVGLLLGVGAAIARELLDTSVTSAEHVAEITSAPILGTIQRDDAAKRPPSAELTKPSPWSEAFRVLRTNMQYLDVDRDHTQMVMTSAVPGEGKTTMAVHLSVTLSQTGQRVALIEADLRRPLIASRLGLDDAVGTTNVLIGQISLHEALQTYGDTTLRVLTCGPIPPNPSELLQSRAMHDLLHQLRAEFDVVVLDGPPLLPVTDSSLLAAQTDGAVVVTRHGSTSKDQLRHAIERLDSVDAHVMGIVINQSNGRTMGRSYGYGYRYGYGYGYSQQPSVSARGARRSTPTRSNRSMGHRAGRRKGVRSA